MTDLELGLRVVMTGFASDCRAVMIGFGGDHRVVMTGFASDYRAAMIGQRSRAVGTCRCKGDQESLLEVSMSSNFCARLFARLISPTNSTVGSIVYLMSTIQLRFPRTISFSKDSRIFFSFSSSSASSILRTFS